MNQNTSFHAHTTAGYLEWSLFPESHMIELHLLACQAVDSVKKTIFLPGKLPGQLTTHSYRPHLQSLTHRIATANWWHICCISCTECSAHLSHPTVTQLAHTKQHVA